jgi:hypothetical protein
MATTTLYQFAGEMNSTEGVPALLGDLDASGCEKIRISAYSDVFSPGTITLILSIVDDKGQGYGPLFTTVLQPATSFTEVYAVPGIRLKLTAVSSQKTTIGVLITGN